MWNGEKYNNSTHDFHEDNPSSVVAMTQIIEVLQNMTLYIIFLCSTGVITSGYVMYSSIKKNNVVPYS